MGEGKKDALRIKSQGKLKKSRVVFSLLFFAWPLARTGAGPGDGFRPHPGEPLRYLPTTKGKCRFKLSGTCAFSGASMYTTTEPTSAETDLFGVGTMPVCNAREDRQGFHQWLFLKGWW
jgi:hypothetical protein